ncbi:cytochrome P450 9e2-like [Pollicipes pollicipes]|uniref:cytochrome P450 9e2-like n=1 Tax=Pollicipes pollicipes TaxID=41117 RepID=UPI001885267E|nr:cytochrome P450 9e2-like [Pollicipes pollicipes]
MTDIVDFEEWIYHKQGGKKFCGYMEMHRPVLYVGDPDLIRAITVKDFEHFTDRRDLVLSDAFKEMLSVVNGKKWRETRSVMSPTFSSSKMRLMHQLCLDNASNLGKYMLEEMQEKGEVQMKDSFGRFTMDNIAACAFGVNCNSFNDPNTEFATHAAALFKPPTTYGFFRFVALLTLPTWLFNKLPDPTLVINGFFSRVVNKTIAHREAKGSSRRDFLQLLLETKDKDGNRVLSNESIVTQSVLFFIAGYDTTATLLTFAGYSLATNPDCQRAAHREIDDVLERYGGQMTYEAVSEMTYMDRVLNETLRMYPPAPRLERQCSKDYILPGTSVHIPRGTLVQMPVVIMHRDPDIYPDPLRFDPDRFLPEEKEKRHPCSYLPFGNGPRNCIAMRFALFEAKVALIAVLRENSLKPGPRTPPPPMPMNTTGFLLSPKQEASYMKVVPRSKD